MKRIGVILALLLTGCGSTVTFVEGEGGGGDQGGGDLVLPEGGQDPGLAPDGASCGEGEDCDSGHCVDGRCCESACTAGCMACSLAAGSAKDGLCWSTCAANQICVDDQCVFDEPPPPPPDSLVNGSFEMGLTGWDAVDLADPFYPLEVAPAGTPNPFMGMPTQPTDGNYGLLHGFDGGGPGEISVSQEIVVPMGATGVQFDYRASWDNFGMLPRTFEVVVEAPAGGVLQATPILVANPQTLNEDTGPLTSSAPLSGFVGQSIRLRFRWYIPEFYTGPASFHLDHVRLY